MKSIELNGFDLSSEVTPAVTTPTGVFLYGGVGTLSFNAIDAQIDTSVNPRRSRSRSATANTPLKQQPSIFLNNITNLVFDSEVDDDSDDAADDADGAVHDQRRGAQLRHRLGHAGIGSGRIPVRVPASRHDRADGHPGDGDQDPDGPRLGQELHGLAGAGAVLVGSQRRRLSARRRHSAATPTPWAWT